MYSWWSRFNVRQCFSFDYVFLIASLFVLLSVSVPRYIVETHAPGSSVYGFGAHIPGDFFQYIYEVKSGMEGTMFFRNIYTNEGTVRLMILEPHYNILGMIGRLLKYSPFIVYQGAYFFSLVTFLIALYLLIKKTIHRNVLRILAAVLTIVSTSVWTLTNDPKEGYTLTDFATHTNWYNVFTKFNTLPPHHFLAITLLIILLLHLRKPGGSLLSYGKTMLLGIALGFIHPYDAGMILAIQCFFVILTTIITRSLDKRLVLHVLLFALVTIPILLYYRYLLIYVWQSQKGMHGTIKWVPRDISTQVYLLGIGPLLIPASLIVFFPSSWKKPHVLILMLWAVLPLLFFYIPDLKIPSNIYRGFQIFHHIPLALLTALGIGELCKKYTLPLRLIAATISLVFILYSFPAYYFTLVRETAPTGSFHHFSSWYTRLQLASPAIQYLYNHSEPESVVLAPEEVSVMIPAFTKNRLVIGHNGTVPDYLNKMKNAQIFLSGKMALDDVKGYLATHNISYILFGVASSPFNTLPYSHLPYLEEVYRHETVSIVKVKL